jgi:hypothetical protein
MLVVPQHFPKKKKSVKSDDFFFYFFFGSNRFSWVFFLLGFEEIWFIHDLSLLMLAGHPKGHPHRWGCPTVG